LLPKAVISAERILKDGVKQVFVFRDLSAKMEVENPEAENHAR
jgi:hypothetical protein